MNNKEFVSRLTKEEIKTIIHIAFVESNKYEKVFNVETKKEEYMYDFREWKNFIFVGVKSIRTGIQVASFNITDFKMIIYYSGCERDLSHVLKSYLANKFDGEYIEYVYNKRIKDAEEEKQLLLKEVPKSIEDYSQKNKTLLKVIK